VHGFRCYDDIARTQNVNECLYSLYDWLCQLAIFPSCSGFDFQCRIDGEFLLIFVTVIKWVYCRARVVVVVVVVERNII